MDETSRRITFVVFPIELILDFLFSPLFLFLCDNNRNLRSFDDVYRLGRQKSRFRVFQRHAFVGRRNWNV